MELSRPAALPHALAPGFPFCGIPQVGDITLNRGMRMGQVMQRQLRSAGPSKPFIGDCILVVVLGFLMVAVVNQIRQEQSPCSPAWCSCSRHRLQLLSFALSTAAALDEVDQILLPVTVLLVATDW
jgi:hypothetical protein